LEIGRYSVGEKWERFDTARHRADRTAIWGGIIAEDASLLIIKLWGVFWMESLASKGLEFKQREELGKRKVC